MVRKGRKVIAEETLTGETPTAGTLAEKAKAAEEAKAVGKPQKKNEPPMIEVRPTRGYMFEPFQRIQIPEGQWTPVRETNWVIDQLARRLLRRK